MSSTLTNSFRRSPQQARATLRREKFLGVAARLIGEAGFEAVTMTAIAEQAGASIGTLYDYFPDKETLAVALMQQYTEEMDEFWKVLLEPIAELDRGALADLLVEGALTFLEGRPAFLLLFGAFFVHPRSAAERQSLRMTFAAAVRRVDPRMTDERAFRCAQVLVELIKGMLAVCKQIDPEHREGVISEFKQMMRFYLTQVAE